MTDSKKLKLIIDATGLTTAAFAESLGLKRVDRLYYVLKGRNGISKELRKLILDKYNNINPDWLTKDSSVMYIDDSKKIEPAEIELLKQELKDTKEELNQVKIQNKALAAYIQQIEKEADDLRQQNNNYRKRITIRQQNLLHNQNVTRIMKRFSRQ
jgi:predicted RNase H-like nuclease (RuvC/YqgF family)